MRYERLKITRDAGVTVHNRPVAPWEIPVLEFLFDEGNVTRLGEFEEVAGEYPAVAKELDRLVRCYGSDPKSGIPYAISVYGTGKVGERALHRLIEDAKAEDEAVATPTPAPKRARKAASDSLLG
jgi:hypothetical protein